MDCPDPSEKTNHFPTLEICSSVVPQIAAENVSTERGSTIGAQATRTERIFRPSTPRAHNCRAMVSTSGSSGIRFFFLNREKRAPDGALSKPWNIFPY
jgi:hypothetical protein